MMKSAVLSYRIPFYSVFFVGLFCLFSCKKGDDAVPTMKKQEANVKMINATQNTIDVYLDKNRINEQSLAFGESNDVKVTSGAKNVSFSVNGRPDVFTTLNFIPSFSYTAFYVEDKEGKGEILAFEDNVSATEAGKARVRFINLSPNFSNSININLPGGNLLVNALAFKESSLDFAIEPNVNMAVYVIGTTGVIAGKMINGTEFEAGKVYTIWISGSSNADINVNKITYN